MRGDRQAVRRRPKADPGGYRDESEGEAAKPECASVERIPQASSTCPQHLQVPSN